MIIKDVISSLYVVLDNASEDELDRVVVTEMLASMLSMMKYEQIFGNLDDLLVKTTVTFSDSTGLVTNSLTNFGDVVFLRFNNDPIDESTAPMLQQYADSGRQAVAFWTDYTTPSSLVNKIQLAIPQLGTLDVWYEPYITLSQGKADTVDFHESLKWCIVFRTAEMLLPMIKFRDERKNINKPYLQAVIMKQAEDWKKVYLEKVNRIGTNKPFTRLPFMAGILSE